MLSSENWTIVNQTIIILLESDQMTYFGNSQIPIVFHTDVTMDKMEIVIELSACIGLIPSLSVPFPHSPSPMHLPRSSVILPFLQFPLNYSQQSLHIHRAIVD